jgi:hypothetical protein
MITQTFHAADPSSATAATRRADCNSDAMPLQRMVELSRYAAVGDGRLDGDKSLGQEWFHDVMAGW